MIKLELDGGYVIRTLDALNIVLEKEVAVTNPKSKNFGSKITRRLGYFADLKSALKDYVNVRINSDDLEACGVKEVVNALKSIEETIMRVTEER